MKEPRWTIYCHIHVASGRRYVGLTKLTMMKRWNSHVYTANRIKGGRPAVTSHFPNAIRKYGKDAFDHEVLQVCDSLEEASAAEERWIDHYDSTNPEKGFNLTKGGKHVPHPIKNPWDRPEYRKKCLPSSRKNQKRATEVASIRGTQGKPEVRAKMSAIMKELANTPEGRAQRMTAAKPGKVLSPEHREKISKSSRSRDPEVRAKMSAGVRKAFSNPEVKAKVVAALKKAMASPEVRARISAGVIRASRSKDGGDNVSQ